MDWIGYAPRPPFRVWFWCCVLGVVPGVLALLAVLAFDALRGCCINRRLYRPGVARLDSGQPDYTIIVYILMWCRL